MRDKAIVGICLIRLQNIEDGEVREGFYIPRPDTSSRLNSLVGGRLFPGVHHLGNFQVHEIDGSYFLFFYFDCSPSKDWKSKSKIN